MGEVVILTVFGGLVGYVGGYAGIGGAPFLVAGLVLALGFDQHTAQGTILAVMLGPMSLPGVWVMRDRVKLLWEHTAVGVLTYAVFSNVGARLAFALPQQALTLAFAGLLLFLGVHYVTRKQGLADEVTLNPDGPTVAKDAPFSLSLKSIAVVGSGVGVAGGLFGIGAGVVMVPLLISALGLHKDDARTLSLAILLPPVSVGAVVEYQGHGGIDWTAAFVVFISYVATNLPGAAIGRRHDTKRFLRITGVVLFILGLAMGGVALA